MDNNLKKRDYENENQYLWRVGNMIDDGYYKNWTEVLSDVNYNLYNDADECYKGESAYRKRYAAAKQFYNDVFTRCDMCDDAKTIQERIDTLRAERHKIAAEKIELNRHQRQDARFDLFYEKIGMELQKLPAPAMDFSGHCFLEVDEKEYMLTIADIHYGSHFVTETNSYSIKECHDRFKRLIEYTRAFIWEKNLKHLNILNLGDEIQGLLRMTDLQLNETSVVKSVVGVCRLLANFLNEISHECMVDYYSVPRSNHNQTRPLGSKASELASEDITYIINQYLTDILSENPNVHIHSTTDRGYIEIPIFKFKIIAHHGHNIKSVDNYINDISAYKREFIDYAFLGHLHSGKTVSCNSNGSYDTEVIVVPSIVGNDPYAEQLMKSSKPAAMIYGFDKKFGLNETHKIILD